MQKAKAGEGLGGKQPATKRSMLADVLGNSSDEEFSDEEPENE
jgi:hypothetical protein